MDGLGREIESRQHLDGAEFGTTPDGFITNYTQVNNQTAVTDPAAMSRTTLTDALGRLTQATENIGGLGYVTSC